MSYILYKHTRTVCCVLPGLVMADGSEWPAQRFCISGSIYGSALYSYIPRYVLNLTVAFRCTLFVFPTYWWKKSSAKEENYNKISENIFRYFLFSKIASEMTILGLCINFTNERINQFYYLAIARLDVGQCMVTCSKYIMPWSERWLPKYG